MSDIKKPRFSATQRYLFVLGMGLVVGVIATVMIMNSVNSTRDPFPHSVMNVMSKNMALLKQNVEQSRCATTDTLPRLHALRVMANDLEIAFPADSTDQRFITQSSSLRLTLDNAIATATTSTMPTDCASVSTTMAQIGESCKGCHQDFK